MQTGRADIGASVRRSVRTPIMPPTEKWRQLSFGSGSFPPIADTRLQYDMGVALNSFGLEQRYYERPPAVANFVG